MLSDYIVALLKHEAVMSEDQWGEVRGSTAGRCRVKLIIVQFMSRELVDFLEESELR